MPLPPLKSDLLFGMLHRLPVPLCLRDRHSRYVWTNEAFCAAFGKTAEELEGKTDFDLLPADQAVLEQTRDERVFQGGRDVFFEDRATVRAGVIGVSGWHLAVRDESDAVQYVLRQWGTVGRRVPNGSAEAEDSSVGLEEQQEQLLREERLLVLGQLAGSLAHQIRNPLCAIINATAVLRRHLLPNASDIVREALQIATDESWSANRIIADLLAYSKIQPPETKSVSLAAVVDTALARQAVPASVHLEQQVSEDRVEVDLRQVADAIANVVRNACEAMEGSGTLTISSTGTAEYVELILADTGKGIDLEPTESMFEPLVTSKDLSMGLGLTTARALVANQGGTLECEKTTGGARFRLRLPKARS